MGCLPSESSLKIVSYPYFKYEKRVWFERAIEDTKTHLTGLQAIQMFFVSSISLKSKPFLILADPSNTAHGLCSK